MQLYAPVDVDQFRHEFPCLVEITEWIEKFLSKPHVDLGRSGPVCPFVPRALQLDTIRMAVIRAKDLNSLQIEEIVSRYRDIFLDLDPKEGELAFYKAILLVFPDVSEEEAFTLIDAVQQKLKPFFVEAGLMIGEFHPRNESPGLHNPNFRPLRSPIPMLAIRYMAESDLPFLDRLTDEPKVRIRYLEAYLTQMSSVIKDEKKLNSARQALARAKAQLQPSIDPTSAPFSPPPVEPFQNTQAPKTKTRKCPFARLVAVFG